MAPRQDSTSVSIRPATFARKILLAGLLALPALAFASEEYSLTVTMPIVRPGEPVSLEKVTFRTWYSITETQVSAVTWDPCESEGQPADCNLVNPVHAAGIKAWLYAYNVQHGEPPEGCYIQVDLSKYQSLDPALQHAVGTADVKGELIRLLVRGIEAGTRTSDHHLDCELRLIPPGSAGGLDPATLPRYVNPVIPPCQETTAAQQTQARAHNAKGMQRYRAGDLAQAEDAFRRAARADCNFFLARTNLASVLALQKRFAEAQTVLWRAYQLDPGRTLEKLITDPDYRQLRRNYRFVYGSQSPVGRHYHDHCTGPEDPANVDPRLPSLMKSAGLETTGIPYRVATRYVFEADFNRNGIPDRVYPLLRRSLDRVLIVFDGHQVLEGDCDSTPMGPYDRLVTHDDDPCRVSISVGAQGKKRGVRLKTDTQDYNRLVCR